MALGLVDNFFSKSMYVKDSSRNVGRPPTTCKAVNSGRFGGGGGPAFSAPGKFFVFVFCHNKTILGGVIGRILQGDRQIEKNRVFGGWSRGAKSQKSIFLVSALSTPLGGVLIPKSCPNFLFGTCLTPSRYPIYRLTTHTVYRGVFACVHGVYQ